MKTQRQRAAFVTYDRWGDLEAIFSTEAVEADKPEFSDLLGPDGRRLRYRPNPCGFDLSKRQREQ